MEIRRACNHRQHRFLRKKRLCRSKDKRRFLPCRPGRGLFSDKRAYSGLSGPSERRRRRNIQGAGRILHRLKKSRRIRQPVSAERKTQSSRTDFRVRLCFSASPPPSFCKIPCIYFRPRKPRRPGRINKKI